jgi:hypothetical protein
VVRPGGSPKIAGEAAAPAPAHPGPPAARQAGGIAVAEPEKGGKKTAVAAGRAPAAGAAEAAGEAGGERGAKGRVAVGRGGKGAAAKGASGEIKAGGSAGEGKGIAGAGPAPPAPRAAIAPAIAAVHQRAAQARSHSPAGVPVASAQEAAKDPRTEQTRDAAEQTVANMNIDPEQAKKLQREDFKRKLRQAVREATPPPKTEGEAKEVMEQGAKTASSRLQGDLSDQREAATGSLRDAAATDVSPSDQKAPPRKDLAPEKVGRPPALVSAAPVVPAPLPPDRLDYSADRAPADQAMAENRITTGQLEKGNESSFKATLETRETAEKHEAGVEARYRQAEAKVQQSAEVKAEHSLARGLAGMHGTREAQIGKVVGQQNATMSKAAAERKKITDHIYGIKENTRNRVGGILKEMDKEAPARFEAGLKAAETAYGAAFDEAKGGIGTWLTTWGEDWEELIRNSLATARMKYLEKVDEAVDQVGDLVAAKLEEAKDAVAQGRKEIKDYVQGLDHSVRQFGQEALQEVSADFDAMGEEIDQHSEALVGTLVQQYKESYERMSAEEERLREANKSLWQKVKDATIGLIKQILAFKDMLLGVLAKAAGVVEDIISDPIGFLGNLIDGVMLGLKNFTSRIGMHLEKGLMEWIFGALSGAGLQMPEKFDLQGIISIVLQVLGLTYANFRARAVAIVGEGIVSTLEQAAEVFKVVVTEGVPGLWRFIKKQLSNLKEMVMDAIFGFIKERVIIAGITWIIGLLNPASAFFKACKAIYDIIMFFINRGSQIMELVNAVVDSIGAIAKGAIGVAATYVEGALAKGIPVAIGFLASLLGLGDPSKPVRGFIDKARSPVNKAMDWVISLAVKGVKAAGKHVAGLFGKKDKGKDEEPKHEDPVKQAKVQAGLAAIDAEEEKYKKEGQITREDAEQVASKVKQRHPVFSSLKVLDGGESWDYRYEASPAAIWHGEPKLADLDRKEIYRMVHQIGRERYAKAKEQTALGAAFAGATKITVASGKPLLHLAPLIKNRPLPRVHTPLTIKAGEVEVEARQGWRRPENIIIKDLHRYPDITKLMTEKGYTSETLSQAMINFQLTGTGDKDIARLAILMFGVESARQVVGAATGPLALTAAQKGTTLRVLFGAPEDELKGGGGIYPQSMLGASQAAKATEESIGGGEITKASRKRLSEEDLERMVVLVYHALGQIKIKNMAHLKQETEHLFKEFDKATGIQ